MLFEEKFKNTKDYDQVSFDKTILMRLPSKNKCAYCRRVETFWVDVNFQLSLCSEECNKATWIEFNNQSNQEVVCGHINRFGEEMKQELAFLQNCEDKSKDIIIVVHDQLDYLRITIDSVVAHTSNYHIYLWDNNSGEETQAYIKELSYRLGDKITVMRSDANLGFIEPNNELASWGTGEYIILLNSDTKVSGGWDKSMIGFLQANEDVKLVGQQGGLLDEKGTGGRVGYGYEIDYIPGWCLCLSRETYNDYGLFNNRLKFAYAEDSELSIRIQAAGYKIYALHLMLVHHYENKTINSVRKKGEIDVAATFAHNHDILRMQWGDYLRNSRVDVRARLKGKEAFDELAKQIE